MRRYLTALLLALTLTMLAAGVAAAPNRADGFAALPNAARVVIMPADIELFSISAGGVVEPKAEWTEAAHRHVRDALRQRAASLGLRSLELPEADADELAEIGTLHAAVARAIAMHHFGPGNLALPTKQGRLDWSLGDAVAPLRDRSQAEYALFVWLRDSYASAERVASMTVMALLGVYQPGGMQTGYASLIDLRDGRVVWFNQLQRASGDLREAGKAGETVQTLLKQFPGNR